MMLDENLKAAEARNEPLLLTDTIDYVATDGNGITSTSTRTVFIEAATTGTDAPDRALTPCAATGDTGNAAMRELLNRMRQVLR